MKCFYLEYSIPLPPKLNLTESIELIMNTQSQINTTVGLCGAETFAGSLQTSRSSGRKLSDCLGDLCDESLKHIMNKLAVAIISISRTATGNKVRSIKLSDSILNGFEGLDQEGSLNPFNATHFNPTRHADDYEWSEHGKGLVDAIKAMCAMCVIYTRYKKVDGDFAYEKCKWDLEAMAEENRHSPQCETITEEQYRAHHPYETGSTILLSQLSTDIFTKSFNDEAEIIRKTLVSKYSSALIEGNEGFDGSRLKFKVENNDPIDVVAVPSPLENQEHPHPKYKVVMDVRANDNNTKRILCKKEGAQTKWHAWSQADEKYKSLTSSQYQREIQRFPNRVGLFDMRGTRTSGTDYEGYPSGSVILKRLRRTLTQDYRHGGRHMSFLPTPRNGEQNYHYIELTWVKKVLTKLIEYNLQKKIDCDLTRLGSLMAEAGKWAEQQIRAAIKSETRFKKDWHKEYDEVEGAEWNGDVSYEENLENATLALQAYNNALLEDEDDDDDDDDVESDDVSDEEDEESDNEPQVVVRHIVRGQTQQEDDDDNTEEEAEEDEEEEEEDAAQDSDDFTDLDDGVESHEDQENIQLNVNDINNNDAVDQVESETASIESFNPAQHEPEQIPVSATTHRAGITREVYNNHLDFLENQDFTEEQGVLAILGDPSNGIKGLKTITQELLQRKYGEGANLLLGMSFMRENVYNVGNWVRDIRNLVTTMYNGTENSILTGSHINRLVIELQNGGEVNLDNQLDEDQEEEA